MLINTVCWDGYSEREQNELYVQHFIYISSKIGNRNFSASFSSHGIFESKHNICDGQCPLRIKFAVFLMESTNVMSA